MANRFCKVALALSVLLYGQMLYAEAEVSEALLKKDSKESNQCPPCKEDKEKKDPEAWVADASLGFNLARGNTDAILIASNVKAEKEDDHSIYHFEINAAFGEQNDDGDTVKTQEYVRGDLAYKNRFDKRRYAGVGITPITDQIAGVKYRVFTNTFLGAFVLKEDDHDFYVEAGPSFVTQKEGQNSDSFVAARFGFGGSWELSENSKIVSKNELFVNVEETEDVLFNATLGIHADLTTDLALVVNVTERFDNNIEEDVQGNDIFVTTALKVSL